MFSKSYTALALNNKSKVIMTDILALIGQI